MEMLCASFDYNIFKTYASFFQLKTILEASALFLTLKLGALESKLGCFFSVGTWQHLGECLSTSIFWLRIFWTSHELAVIHIQFWAYGSWDSLFPISMSQTANLRVQNTIFNNKSAIQLHPWTRWNKNFASRRQNYAQKMQDAQVTKSLSLDCIFEREIGNL